MTQQPRDPNQPIQPVSPRWDASPQSGIGPGWSSSAPNHNQAPPAPGSAPRWPTSAPNLPGWTSPQSEIGSSATPQSGIGPSVTPQSGIGPGEAPPQPPASDQTTVVPDRFIPGQPSSDTNQPRTDGSPQPRPVKPPLRPYAPSQSSSDAYARPHPAPPKRHSLVIGIVGLSVIMIVIGVLVAILVKQRGITPTPTPSPTVSSPSPSKSPSGGPTTSALGYSITAPAGWTYSPSSPNYDVKMVDASNNKLIVYVWKNADAASYCDKQIRATQVWVPGTITTLPDATLKTGDPFPGYQLEGQENIHMMRCVSHNGRVYSLASEAKKADAAAVATAYEAVTASWSWV